MRFLIGMLVGTMLAGSGFVLGFACCMAMLAPKRDELQATEPESAAQREAAVSRLTPTIPVRPMTPTEITRAVVAELERAKSVTFGVNGSRGKALEIL